MSSHSDQSNQSTNKSSHRRGSSLPEDLQNLLDKEELNWDLYGDYENSWTTTRTNNDPPMVVGDMRREQQDQKGRVRNMEMEGEENQH
ncbi:hypothetical protein BDV35DRAFT_256397 [Aspergillus flavus]|uniref:Uncharacterized protein n=1 Tax=Aspergillus flavus TaxID=5059 RepID=A0A364MMI1_ASPFL|nr:hypothetical protein BDV35DRAFT_256397 [Aspergillus flavus]KAJ1713418.1 hypothetical protein NYO67_4464 [Aspergillus flavus]RAQ70096.1 hypothetical protein COH20_008156 [Aspergillus flavus]RAQ80400.1 hypothetical protein COH21_012424 [Aspergillus flavus]RMZ46290.1 hypothetical protein CA14_008316 [Aspergillus flavus]